MRCLSFFFRFVFVGIIVLLTSGVQAKVKDSTYKSLFWEITGNGLKKPSYLFGTMHISNKMVFHLSDSFYAAIRNVDVVAIELNPEAWQSEIPRINKQTEIYKFYNATYYTDYLKETSFQAGNFVEQLQECLRFEPALNDQLLYRNERGMDNFQEDTYLDLYIYQTGRKLGKEATGVETFMGSQRMMIEAYVDMAKDNNKNKYNNDDVKYANVGRDMQDAYRKGDLDLLDSINKLTEYSPDFTEKFLYQRNDIQANAMDSIMKLKSLFVGVGAAHLPGKRGVIEILRKKGYVLRPIYMQNRDASQKKNIDSLTVPVAFTTQYAADSFYSVAVPGKLNDVEKEGVLLRHYADMANGSYYLITRIKTNALFNGYTEKKSLALIDSLLYENIPGEILSRKQISKDGYEGWDVINRTKRNEIQHYQIWVTAAEILVFKMGGIGNYVYGKEANQFFNSIALKPRTNSHLWYNYSPTEGGFRIQMPAKPQVSYSAASADNLPEWRYEAIDATTGDRYGILKKSIYSFDFIGTDSFDLQLIAESFCANPDFEKQATKVFSQQNGRPVIDIALKSKGGDYIKARAVLMGPQYYLLVSRSKDKLSDPGNFFNSFGSAPYRYAASLNYTDSFLNFSVLTPIRPSLDNDVWSMVSYMKSNEDVIKNLSGTYNNNRINNYANFISEETGEVVVVNAYVYPEYFYVKDSVAFMRAELYPDSTLMVIRKSEVGTNAAGKGWIMEYMDTASTRKIRKLILLKGNIMLTAQTMLDTTLPESTFIQSFYQSLRIGNTQSADLFKTKTVPFFRDYYSQDSTIRKKAKSALPFVYFGAEGYKDIKTAITRLSPTDRDYTLQKVALLAELGYIRDSTVVDDVVLTLIELYRQSGDTALFQNSILKSLSRLLNKSGIRTFKDLLLKDPPAFEERYEYQSLFASYADSLQLAAQLYPELLHLSAIEDFKNPVRELLVRLVDSGYVLPEIYEDYVGNIFFDAKVSLKKIQRLIENNRAEQTMGLDATEERGNRNRAPSSKTEETDKLSGCITLLAPYYTKNPGIPAFFDRLLQSSSPEIKMKAALSLLRYKQRLPDTIWQSLAKSGQIREELWLSLKKAGQPNLLPKQYRNPDTLASDAFFLLSDKQPAALVQVAQRTIPSATHATTMYFYKYKMKEADEWKIATSAVTVAKNKDPELFRELVMFTNKQLRSGKSVGEQVDDLFKKTLISIAPSGKYFYTDAAIGSGYDNVRLVDRQ